MQYFRDLSGSAFKAAQKGIQLISSVAEAALTPNTIQRLPEEEMIYHFRNVINTIDEHASMEDADTAIADSRLYDSNIRESLKIMLMLLKEEAEEWYRVTNNAHKHQAIDTPCMDALLQYLMIQELCKRAIRDLPRGCLPLILNTLATWIRTIKFPLLPNQSIHKPVSRIISMATRFDALHYSSVHQSISSGSSGNSAMNDKQEMTAYKRRIEAGLTDLLGVIWRKVADNPPILDFFTLTDSNISRTPHGTAASTTAVINTITSSSTLQPIEVPVQMQMDILTALITLMGKQRVGGHAKEALLIAMSMNDYRVDHFILYHTKLLSNMVTELVKKFQMATEQLKVSSTNNTQMNSTHFSSHMSTLGQSASLYGAQLRERPPLTPRQAETKPSILDTYGRAIRLIDAVAMASFIPFVADVEVEAEVEIDDTTSASTMKAHSFDEMDNSNHRNTDMSHTMGVALTPFATKMKPMKLPLDATSATTTAVYSLQPPHTISSIHNSQQSHQSQNQVATTKTPTKQLGKALMTHTLIEEYNIHFLHSILRPALESKDDQVIIVTNYLVLRLLVELSCHSLDGAVLYATTLFLCTNLYTDNVTKGTMGIKFHPADGISTPRKGQFKTPTTTTTTNNDMSPPRTKLTPEPLIDIPYLLLCHCYATTTKVTESSLQVLSILLSVSPIHHSLALIDKCVIDPITFLNATITEDKNKSISTAYITPVKESTLSTKSNKNVSILNVLKSTLSKWISTDNLLLNTSLKTLLSTISHHYTPNTTTTTTTTTTHSQERNHIDKNGLNVAISLMDIHIDGLTSTKNEDKSKLVNMILNALIDYMNSNDTYDTDKSLPTYDNKGLLYEIDPPYIQSAQGLFLGRIGTYFNDVVNNTTTTTINTAKISDDNNGNNSMLLSCVLMKLEQFQTLKVDEQLALSSLINKYISVIGTVIICSDELLRIQSLLLLYLTIEVLWCNLRVYVLSSPDLYSKYPQARTSMLAGSSLSMDQVMGKQGTPIRQLLQTAVIVREMLGEIRGSIQAIALLRQTFSFSSMLSTDTTAMQTQGTAESDVPTDRFSAIQLHTPTTTTTSSGGVITSESLSYNTLTMMTLPSTLSTNHPVDKWESLMDEEEELQECHYLYLHYGVEFGPLKTMKTLQSNPSVTKKNVTVTTADSSSDNTEQTSDNLTQLSVDETDTLTYTTQEDQIEYIFIQEYENIWKNLNDMEVIQID